MAKNDKLKEIEAALHRAAESAKTGGRDVRSGRFLTPSRLATAARQPDKRSSKK